ncbi:MAG: xylosidase [Bacteroidia bacterium]|nr:MAG: xylosidase [Bacteroidia bacterium]
MRVRYFLLLALFSATLTCVEGQNRHGISSRFPTYEGRVMCGYQGWFRAPGDGAGKGWGHYAAKGNFENEFLTIDLWPDVSEYEKTYETSYLLPGGEKARVFSSWDESTVDLHFKWMKQYGIDGVFMQRFFGVTKTPESRKEGNVILSFGLKASQKYGRAIAVMYDLSGLKATGEDCSSVIEDWKQLVDQVKITSGGYDQTYLYHDGKPLVAIWGLGFPDRPYNIRNIGIDKLIDFLKNDPEYGGCSVMLGVPAYFRDLNVDCLPDPYLHEVMKMADVIMPWTVQRFTPLLHNERERISAYVSADIDWCSSNGLDYAACVWPGFTWYNLSRFEFGGIHPVNQIPRQKGKFYWMQVSAAIESGAKMLYIAMFDEIDEGTAIFKCSNELPEGNFKLVDYEGLPTDHYLWLTGIAGKMLRKELPFTLIIPDRD